MTARRSEFTQVYLESLRERMSKDGRLKINQKELEQLTRMRGGAGGS